MNLATPSRLELASGDFAEPPVFSWELDQLGPGPGDKFILFDDDDTPRLILTADEVAKLHKKVEQVSRR